MAWMVAVPLLAIVLVFAGAVAMSLDSGRTATGGRRMRRVVVEGTGQVEMAPVVEREFPSSYAG